MANTLQAKKRARQAVKRRARNMSHRSHLRTMIKNVRKALGNKELEKAQEAYKKMVPIVDRMVGKGLLEKNTAARYKSRLNTAVKTAA